MEYKLKIMEDFMNQFIQKDCKDIKVDNIAENLGISKRTLYEIFPSKNEMIAETLDYYQKLNQQHLLLRIKDEENPLIRILTQFFTLFKDAMQISLGRLINLKKYYPEIAESLIASHAEFLKKTIIKDYLLCQKQGLVFTEIQPEMLVALLVNGEKDHMQRTVKGTSINTNSL